MSIKDLKSRYDGEILNCVRQGQGTYVYPFNEIYSYKGPWVQGIKHGSNAEFDIAGYSNYTGDFKDGEITGYGSRRWDDGRVYEGEWLDGEMNGKGKWFNERTKEEYDGDFVDNRRHGKGNLKLPNGCTYEGEFVEHKLCGDGVFRWPNKFKMSGKFVDNKVNGPLEINWDGIGHFEGDFSKGLPNGKGIFFALDKSFEYYGSFSRGVPVNVSDSLKVELDRSVVESADLVDKKDKKKDLKGKKVPQSKRWTKEDLAAMINVVAGTALGKLVITTTEPKDEPSVSPSRAKSKISVTQGSGTTLPAPSELKREFILRIRQIPETPNVEELGDPIFIWRRNPSLVETASAWERFPPGAMVFIDGVLVPTGQTMQMEATCEAVTDEDKANMTSYIKIAEEGTVTASVGAGELKGLGESLQVVVDLKFNAAAMAEAATNVTRFCVHSEIVEESLHDAMMTAAQLSAYSQITVLSISREVDDTDTSNTFSLDLVLLVPVDQMEATAEWWEAKKAEEREEEDDGEGSQENESSVASMPPAPEWQDCVWELRMTRRSLQPLGEEEDVQPTTPGKGFGSKTCVCRWTDCLVRPYDWHSLALSIRLPLSLEGDGAELAFDGQPMSGVELQRKSPAGEGTDWLPGPSFFHSDTARGDSPAKDTSSAGGSLTDLPCLQFAVGGPGFDGCLKVLAVATELHMLDPEISTGVYAEWARNKEAEHANIREAELRAKLNEAAVEDINAHQPPTQPAGAPHNAKALKKGKGSEMNVAPPKPVGIVRPPDCQEMTEVKFWARGGRGEVDRVIIPPTTCEGVYAIEVVDKISNSCIAKSTRAVSESCEPADSGSLCQMFKAFESDYSIRLFITVPDPV